MQFTDNLFDAITSFEIDALIQEEELKEGYEFYYVVDTFDIISYIYPLGLYRNDQDGFKKDYILAQQLTLIDFFNKENTKPLLFFDEYISEFKRLREYVERTTQYKDYTQIVLQKEFDKFIATRPEKILKSPALALSLNVSIGETLNSVEKFNDLKKRLRIEASDFEADNLPDNFIACFKDIKKSELAFTLLDEIKKLYIPRPDETEEDIYHLLLQKFKDCCAVDRIIHINKYLEQEKVTNKDGKQMRLLFLSSDNSARTRFPQFMGSQYPKINDKEFNFFRNTGQLFLQLLCDNKYIQKRPDYLKMLHFAKQAAIDKQHNREYSTKFDFLQEKYIEKINDTRRPIQINGLMRFFEKLQKLESSFHAKPDSESQKLIDTVGVEAKAAYPVLQKQLIAFENLPSEYSLQSEFLESLKRIEEESKISSVFLLIRGNDHIYGRNHHLPILFRLEGQFQTEIQDLITALLDDLDFNRQTKDTLITQLTKIAKAYLEKKTYTAEMFLMRAFLFMILPFGDKKSEDKKNNSNDDAISDLKLGNRLLEKENPLKKEFLYALCWANRRNKRYTEAIKNAEDGLEIDDTDPRFYHGLSLVYYSQYIEAATKEIAILDKAIENYEKALCLYVDWYAKSTDYALDTPGFSTAVTWFVNPSNRIHKNEPIQLRFIRKNITVILFAIVLMRVLKFENHGPDNEDLIIDARDILVKAKILIIRKEGEDEYRKYPEYLYIEAKLECIEATLRVDIIEKLDKLNHAKEALDKMKDQTTRPEVTELKKKINDLQQLNNPTTLNPTTHV